MAFLEKLFTSFHNYADGNTRIGELNRIWYDSNSNTFRIQLDKVTPGGTIISGGSNGLTTATVNSIFTITNISTFINDAHYIQNETGVNSVAGTANQVIVTDLGGRNIQLSTPQNLNTTATVRFGDLTVQNISILGTNTNLTSIEIQGYRLYLASSATNLSQINGGGIQLGTTATGVHSIFWNSGGYWDTDSDGIKTLTLEATTSTLGTLEVLNGAVFGYVNQDLILANAYIQVNSNVNNFSQIAIINHNTGTNASADIVATNDTGNDSTGFIDMGINSSVYNTSSWIINGANDGYLYVAGGSLAIGTDQVSGEIKTFLGTTDNPTIISVANATTITYSVDLMPSIDAEYLLGRPGLRWKGIYVGTGSVWINDISLGTDAELTVNNGVLYVNGAYQLQVGQLKFFNNTIESTTGAIDIQIGLTTSTANLVLNRNVVLAPGKTFGLIDTVLGTTATMAVSNGVLTINGANQLQVGQLKFIDNTIESITSSTNIQIGYTGDTGNITLNRNTVLATGKSLTINGNFLHNGLDVEQPNYVTISSAGTYTASTLTSINILLYTAGSVNVTWTMPPNPIDGQVCKWTNASTQTSVFFISPGVTLVPAISGPFNAGTKFQYIYRLADNKWYACP